MGRSSRGDFNLWHIDGGEHIFKSIPACQFSIFEQAPDQLPQAYALCTEAPEGSLGSWGWYGLNSEFPKGNYHALYPRSWFVYKNVFQAELVCEQFSPIVPHNYQETSYPVAVFEWTVRNPGDRPLTLSILLTWQNTVGWFTNTVKAPEVQLRDDGSPVYEYRPAWGDSQGNWNQQRREDGNVGLVMDRIVGQRHKVAQDDTQNHNSSMPQEGEGQWAIATFSSPVEGNSEKDKSLEVFTQSRWNPVGDGSEIWQTFAKDGSVADVDDPFPVEQVGEQTAVALAVRFTLQPGETRQIPFVVAWDFPVTEFAQNVAYYRRYTDFFDRSGKNAWTIATTALQQYKTWQTQIQDWQEPILQRSDLPDWFKMALFNELYLLTDGGSLWTAATAADPVGQFGVLECLDYAWYESLDVRLYGSFGLLLHWPQLEKAVIRAFARAIPQADDRTRVIGYYYTIGTESPMAQRKLPNATPHDLGAPNEHPWEKTNYTSYQDCNQWKDLASDFVLQVYRDFQLTGATDIAFLADCWPAVVQALHYLKGFDRDEDGIPENSGAPDQTFDDWRLQGISAYCGGLWLAALEAAIAIAQILKSAEGDRFLQDSCQKAQTTFQTWLNQAKPLYQKTLWNGQYYDLDSNSGIEVVMADQLCGQFYARLLRLPDIVPEACVSSALQTVYDTCFLRFHDGKFGAANGLRLDGSPFKPKDTHPLEVWTGINFGLAAFLVQMDLKLEGFRLAEAVVRQIYDNGLQFRTPEAITANGTFRASHYLRAMAIWSILYCHDLARGHDAIQSL
jgi:non-lysosomal glucosylceramidase